jgi:hypothetical protein
MELQVRSLGEMLENGRFSTPEDWEVWRERLETNGLYYAANYVILFLATIFVSAALGSGEADVHWWGLISICVAFLHATLRKRSQRAKASRFQREIKRNIRALGDR